METAPTKLNLKNLNPNPLKHKSYEKPVKPRFLRFKGWLLRDVHISIPHSVNGKTSKETFNSIKKKGGANEKVFFFFFPLVSESKSFWKAIKDSEKKMAVERTKKKREDLDSSIRKEITEKRHWFCFLLKSLPIDLEHSK